MNYLDKRDNRDIIEHIQKRYFIKGTVCAFLSMGVLIFFYLYAYAYFADRLGVVNGVLACLLGMALPFFLLGLHREIFDRSWEGELVSLKTHLVARGYGGKVPHIYEYIILTVRTENDIVTVDRPARELSRFKVGDRLRHIRGTKYYQALRKDSSMRDCVMCGCLVRESGSDCPHCGFSLVKFELNPTTEVHRK